MPRAARYTSIQDYLRELSGLAKYSLFPQCTPPVPNDQVLEIIRRVALRCNSDSRGRPKERPRTPQEIVSKALKHIREWTDPLEGVSLLTSRPVEEVLLLDTFPAELHTHRMNLGNFYHYLILEFMQTLSTRTNSSIERAFAGQREGDIVADLRTPGDSRGMRLYGSVKKNRQTVGGQDFKDAGSRLEGFAIGDQARNRPYLCAYIAVNPIPGKRNYEDSRFIAGNRSGQRHSSNSEIWGPEFVFPYVCGHSPAQIYEMARPIVEEQFPYYTLEFQEEASRLLTTELTHLGLVADGKLDREALLGYLTSDSARGRRARKAR